MNKTRRNEISTIIHSLVILKDDIKSADIMNRLDNISSDIECVMGEEEYYRDNGIPENMQDSDKWYAADEAVDALQEAYDSLQEAIDHLDAEEYDEALDEIDSAIESLENAQA